jgi:hypothetical protein
MLASLLLDCTFRVFWMNLGIFSHSSPPRRRIEPGFRSRTPGQRERGGEPGVAKTLNRGVSKSFSLFRTPWLGLLDFSSTHR